MADVSKIQDLSGTIYDVKDSVARNTTKILQKSIQDNYTTGQGNLLPEFCDFPTRGGTPSKPVNVVWSVDKAAAIITNSESVNYNNYIGLYDNETFVMPTVLNYDTEYTIHYTTTDPNVVLCIQHNSNPEVDYTGDAALLLHPGDSFILYIKVLSNSVVNAEITVSMPFLKSNLDLDKQMHNLDLKIDEIDNKIPSYDKIVFIKEEFGSGGYSTTTGATTTNNTRLRIKAPYATCIHFGDYVEVQSPYEMRVLIYSSFSIGSGSFVTALGTEFASRWELPEEYVGYYCTFVFRKIGEESSDISADADTLYQYVKYHHRIYNGKNYSRVRQYERFWVFTNKIPRPNNSVGTKTVEDSYVPHGRRCIISLPEKYQPTGDPVPAIMVCHGLHGFVSTTAWYGTSSESSDFLSMVEEYVSNGYAVFDVDQINATAGDASYDLGCPEHMEGYLKLWGYVKAHYNVQDQLMIQGYSQGCFPAMNFLHRYPGMFKCGLFTGARASIKSVWDRDDTTPVVSSTKYATESSYTSSSKINYYVGVKKIAGANWPYNIELTEPFANVTITAAPSEFYQYYLDGGIYYPCLIRRTETVLDYYAITDVETPIKSEIATKFGFDDQTGATYEEDKVLGDDAYANIIWLDGSKPYLPWQLPPIKVVTSEADLNAYQVTYDTFTALKNGGNHIEWRILTTASHGEACSGAGFVEEYRMWFDRFR